MENTIEYVNNLAIKCYYPNSQLRQSIRFASKSRVSYLVKMRKVVTFVLIALGVKPHAIEKQLCEGRINHTHIIYYKKCVALWVNDPLQWSKEYAFMQILLEELAASDYLTADQKNKIQQATTKANK